MAVPLILVQALVALIGLLVYHQLIRKRASHKGLQLPPGPKPLPIIGNMLDLPPAGVPEFQHWLKHKDAYGPISSVSMFGQTLVLVHDTEAVQHLLEKKSMVTAGRPWLRFACEMCGFDTFLSIRNFDDACRRQRKFLHQYIGTKTLATNFSNVQELESKRLLVRALKEPRNMLEHLKVEAGAIILKVAYGYSIERQKTDPMVYLIERQMKNVSEALVPMAWLVDTLPFLQYLPEGLPGMSFKETARQYKKVADIAASIPYDFVRSKMAGYTTYRPSFTSNLIEELGSHSDDTAELKVSPEDEYDIKWSAGIMYAAGADTTVLSLYSFIMAMIMFPDVQRKAQEEIDRVIGPDRLPGLQDQDKLPYVDALITEVLRWYPIAPLGLVHRLAEDIVYKDYLIPKGAMIIPAVWWFTHDPQVYPDPHAFMPERFLEPRKEADPRPHVFGYGRRKCPGRHFADASIFITAAQLLATFRMSKEVDDQGKEMEVQVVFQPGIVSHPPEFPYKIEPRSEKHAELVRNLELEQPLEESDTGLLGSRDELRELGVEWD